MNDEKSRRDAFRIIFLFSQIYEICWLIIGIYNLYAGVDGGWLIPSLSSHELVYGWDAFTNTVYMAVFVSIVTPLAVVPIYQCIWILVQLVRLVRKKFS